MNLKLKSWLRIFTGVALGAVFGAIFAIVEVIFFECPSGHCIISECVEVNEECYYNSYDPRTGEYTDDCCAQHKTKEIAFRKRLIDQIKLYSFICSVGLGIALGIFIEVYYRNRKKQ